MRGCSIPTFSFALFSLALVGCDDTTGPGDGMARLNLGFTSGVAAPFASPSAQFSGVPSAAPYAGSNGTVDLTEAWVIVAEFELERVESTVDCDSSDSGNDCEEFSTPPALVQLPLDGTVISHLTVDIPEGMYDELELEIEDLELDDEEEDQAVIDALWTAVRAEHPDWPTQASLLLVGTFTPTGGTAVPFRTFVEAEIEIEIELSPPLDATGIHSFNIVVIPSLWIERSDGTVLDLSAWDFPTTGIVPELEIEVENSFDHVEIDES